MPNLVFVYGTLLSGESNNYLLQNSEFIDNAITEDEFTMYTNGYYPAITIDPTCHIVGELWEVSDKTLEDLNALEGYDPKRPAVFYDRITISVILSTVGITQRALVYVMEMNEPKRRGMSKLRHGNFKGVKIK